MNIFVNGATSSGMPTIKPPSVVRVNAWYSFEQSAIVVGLDSQPQSFSMALLPCWKNEPGSAQLTLALAVHCVTKGLETLEESHTTARSTGANSPRAHVKHRQSSRVDDSPNARRCPLSQLTTRVLFMQA